MIDTPVLPPHRPWTEATRAPLPPDIVIGRLQKEGDGLYYHSAVVVAWQDAGSPSSKEKNSEIAHPPGSCIIYTPHGISPSALSPIHALNTLALLHGLHDVRLDWRQQLNLGAHNGLAAQKTLRAKYWVGTHDEVKPGRGVVSWFLRRKVISVEEAVKSAGEGDMKGELGWRELANGERLVLA